MRNGQVLRLPKGALVVIFGSSILSCVCNAGEFYADRVIKSGQMTVTSRCYVRGSSSRSETTMGSEKRIIINRPDKKALWMLNPASSTFVVRKCAPAYTDYITRLVNQGGKKKLVKMETVSGQACDKYVISFSSKVTGTTSVWVSRKLGHPIKILTNTDSIIYENIRVGKLSNALFEVPKQYKRR